MANPQRPLTNVTHQHETRVNIPTAELESFVAEEEAGPSTVTIARRNRELDPQLLWRGKDAEDESPLEVVAAPIYIQEKIHAKTIIADLQRRNADQTDAAPEVDQAALFDGWGKPLDPEDQVEFYQHQEQWSNRLILGDSLLAMASLAEKEALKGQVQCIYFDPPYGIRFGSNWQMRSDKRSGQAENNEGVSHEPEVIKAFRDTWYDGVHSYLSYLRDRLIVARELLTESGSIFVQIGEENNHRVRTILDEVFGNDCAMVTIVVQKKGNQKSSYMAPVHDYVHWYTKTPHKENRTKFQRQFVKSKRDAVDNKAYTSDLTNGGSRPNQIQPVSYQGKSYLPTRNRCWSTTSQNPAGGYCGMDRLIFANRIYATKNSLLFKKYSSDAGATPITNLWAGSMNPTKPIYVVQTSDEIVKRCMLMTTDPGDLVLDPTCGSGTTAFVAEQYGRRWITMDTSRVAITLARARLMGARFDAYLLQDSQAGHAKECELAKTPPIKTQFGNDIRAGFVYRRAPRIVLGQIANNTEIEQIWEHALTITEPLRAKLNASLGTDFEPWEIPATPEKAPGKEWPKQAINLHEQWRDACQARQTKIDASITRNADIEYFTDRPYTATKTVRVAGPFTVESLSPHRITPADARDDLLLEGAETELPEHPSRRLRPKSVTREETRFIEIVREQLLVAGVSNTKKGGTIRFTAVEPWGTGRWVQFVGTYEDEGEVRRMPIWIGPEHGTITLRHLRKAAREAADEFEQIMVMGFSFEANANDDHFMLGRIDVLQVRLNNDLHMADRLKASTESALFVMVGEPDIALEPVGVSDDKRDAWRVEIRGVDIFKPTTGEVFSSSTKDIACWFLDTDYNEEAFFVRHAYFCGGGRDPYEQLSKALNGSIDADAWASIYQTISYPFPYPENHLIAVKAINHYGDEVLKVFDLRKY